MKTIIRSNSRPLSRALCTLLFGIAALWAMPRNALGRVGEYNATTGAAINANLIPNGGGPLALSGNTLFVWSAFGTVGKYDATTGAAINANFITGLILPGEGLALSGNDLFVANSQSTVG